MDRTNRTKYGPSGRKGHCEGFTMIELLTVVMVMAILAGIVLGISGYASKKADNAKAMSDLQKIRNALDAYQIQYGFYPMGLNGHMATNPAQEWVDFRRDMTNYSDEIKFTDPWGLGYYYRSISPQSYRLWSFGVDGKSGSSNSLDDVTL